MSQKALVNQDTCIGCNTCTMLDPDTFDLDTTTYKAFVKNGAPTPSSKTEESMTCCPVGAISIVDE